MEAVLDRIQVGQVVPGSPVEAKFDVSQVARELPAAPSRCAHFHFNVERPWRAAGIGQALYERFEARVRQEVPRGRIVGVYGQMALGSRRRRAELFRRLGWEIYDVRPFTKYGGAGGQVMTALFKRLAIP